jgi:hypothetical protein
MLCCIRIYAINNLGFPFGRECSMRTTVCMLVATLLLVCAASSHASTNPYANPSFETGDLTTWDTISKGGSEVVVTTWPGASTTYNPKVGEFFLVVGGGGDDNPEVVFHAVHLDAGDVLSGWAAFDAWDEGGEYDDLAAVKIYDANNPNNDKGLATPWMANVSSTGSGVSGPWTQWSWTATATGDYFLAYGAANEGDNKLASYGLFDNEFTINGPSRVTPEPGTMALLLMGLPMAALLRRRK